jgi:DNA (cytosine-5)-methyltransferase 1
MNPFCNRVLNHHFPDAICYEDIKQTDFSVHKGKIDILTGGFPCQPYSAAGKRLGKEDDRHLWPEMLRAIREIQPCWVVGENVLGLVNWNEGLVFEEVQTDLEAQGYEVQPYVLPAAGVGAPHRRDRVWFVAHSDNNRHNTKRGEDEKKRGVPNEDWQEMGPGQFDRASVSSTTSDTYGIGLQREGRSTKLDGRRLGIHDAQNYSTAWEDFPTQSPVCGGNDGLPRELDGITFSKWRNESIKAYGNAIVPQVVFQIFKAIERTQ